MSPCEVSVPAQEGQTYEPNPERGERALDLLQNTEPTENLQELKSMVANRAWSDVFNLLKDIHLAHQATERMLQAEYQVLRTKYDDLKKYLKNPEPEKPSVTIKNDLEPSLPANRTPEPERRKNKRYPDPRTFINDGDPTWDDWHVDMTAKLRSEPDWDEQDRKAYVLRWTGKDARKLIQSGYLTD